MGDIANGHYHDGGPRLVCLYVVSKQYITEFDRPHDTFRSPTKWAFAVTAWGVYGSFGRVPYALPTPAFWHNA